MTRYQREKKSIQKYAKTPKGRTAHRKSKIKYRKSVRGNAKRRTWNKGLSITEEKKAILAFENFDGKCQCCGTKEPKIKGRTGWHLDHKGKKFRGILCHQCNCGIAFLRDNIRILRAAIAYLKRTR